MRILQLFTLPPHVFLKKAIRKLYQIRERFQKKQITKALFTYKINVFKNQDRLLKGLIVRELGVRPGSACAVRTKACRINRGNREESHRISQLLPRPFEGIDWEREDPFALGNYWLQLRGVEFRNQVLDFMASNPPQFGPHWSSSMPVAVRLIQWLRVYERESSFDADFESLFLRSVYEHGSHLYDHIEWDPYRRSHRYLAIMSGLLFASVYLPSTKETTHWFNFAFRELKTEMEVQKKQVTPEADLCYQMANLAIELARAKNHIML